MTSAPVLPLADPTFLADPYPVLAAARERAAVQWDDGLGMWLALSHAAANLVLRDRRFGRLWVDRAPGERLAAFNLIHRHAILEQEPPDHTRLRRLVSAAFARGHVARLRPRIHELAQRLADDVADATADGGSADLVALYAEPLPVAVIAELLGVPEVDRGPLRPWSQAIVAMYEYGRSEQTSLDAEAAAAQFVAYLRELARARAADPGADLVSHLVAVRDAAGDRLSEDELVTTCILLLNAGHEASVNVTANGTRALLQAPDQWARLRADPTLLPTAVEELIRFDGPLQLFERTATADVEVAGVRVRSGQKIAALLGAADRDPAVFTAPDELDVGRTDNPHVGFGAGIHFCLGAPLARVELEASFGTLLSRFPGLTPAGPGRRRPGFVLRGFTELPVSR